MKKNLFLSISLVLLSLIIYSCHRDLRDMFSPKSDLPGNMLEEARIWHSQYATMDQNTVNAISLKTNTTGSRQSPFKRAFIKLNPLWDKAWKVKSSTGIDLLIVPTVENLVQNKDIKIRRFFIFSYDNNHVKNGEIVEFVGNKFDVSGNQEKLAAAYNQNFIAGFNGAVLRYDINYFLVSSHVYASGKQINQLTKISLVPRSGTTQAGNKLKVNTTTNGSTNGSSNGSTNGSSNGSTNGSSNGYPSEPCTAVYWYTYQKDSDGNVIFENWTFLYYEGDCDNTGGGSGTTDTNAMNTSQSGGTTGYGGNTPPPAPEDPCGTGKTTAQTNTNAMVTNNTSMTSSFNTTKTYASAGKESAFNIDKVGTTYTASTPQQSSTPYESSNTPGPNTVALGHGHDKNHSAPPSPYDVYQLGELDVLRNGAINTSFVISPTAKYALVVTDLNMFKSFYAQYSDNYLKKDANGAFTGDLNTDFLLGLTIFDVARYAAADYSATHSTDPNNPTDAEIDTAGNYGEEAGLVYFLDFYDTGIALLKDDGTGNYKPLHYSSKVQNGVTLYVPSPCN